MQTHTLCCTIWQKLRKIFLFDSTESKIILQKYFISQVDSLSQKKIGVRCTWSICQVSVKYRPSIGQASANYWQSIGKLKTVSAKTHLDRLSAECWPAIDQVSTGYRPSVDPVTTDYRSTYQSTMDQHPSDISTDIPVETTFSKHNLNP